MLSYLLIKNFAIIEDNEILFNSGMTTITGETGAGKSILLSALNIALGSRIDKTQLKNTQKSEITAIFNVINIPHAQSFLKQHELTNKDEVNECILRRVIYTDGKSRAFINGTPVTLTQLKHLSERMISIYGQHAHHALAEHKVQLERLDSFAGLNAEAQALKSLYLQIHKLNQEITDEEIRLQAQQTEQKLLQYQYDELIQLELQASELEQLDEAHKRLASVESQIQTLGQITDIVYDNEQSLIGQIDHLSASLASIDNSQIKNIEGLLEQAKVYLQECSSEVRDYVQTLEVNPEKLFEMEKRLEQIYQSARKHKIEPRDLHQHILNIGQSLESLSNDQATLDQLKAQQLKLQQSYHTKANTLSKKRKKAALDFAKQIEGHIHKLNIPQGQFHIAFKTLDKATPSGLDQCEFQINFNKGQTPQAIDKIASGGELSRIGLAIHVVASKRIAPPTLIFDEVDVGISGATAEIVGGLLKQISQKAQILCITHQAQVSIQGHQQLHIKKEHQHNKTTSHVIALSDEERIQETARIIGGVDITDQTLLHAKEMFESFHK